MILTNLSGREKRGYTTFGCLWEKGTVPRNSSFTLRDENGLSHPVQSRETAYWPDGSIKWTAHTVNASALSSRIEVLPGQSAAPEKKLLITETGDAYLVDAVSMQLKIPKRGENLFEALSTEGVLRVQKAQAQLLLETEETGANGSYTRHVHRYSGDTESVSVESAGPLQAVFCIRGTHRSREAARFPFIIRLYIGLGESMLRIRHTFLPDGECRLKGIGIRCTFPLTGEKYNRHIAIETDGMRLHEECNILRTWRPRMPQGMYTRQVSGELLFAQNDAEKAYLAGVKGNLPDWSSYSLCQDAPEHFVIRKRTGEQDVCALCCLHGKNAPGVLAAGGEGGGLMMAIRDFHLRHPAGLCLDGLDRDVATMDAWFCSPDAEAIDLRHYTQSAYDQTYYEGFPDKGADPAGIACSGEMLLSTFGGSIPSAQQTAAFARLASRPPVYFGEAKYYHDLHAFGPWGMINRDNACAAWLEDQLDKAFQFYKNEVFSRNWTGLFDYGDFMHTYDVDRHVWRYDIGGYAWQNTELMPTMWLWLAFLRSGREDIFSVAEAMTRHCSETDIYHTGKYRGLGTRHNVSHWGCPCKELRVAQAANYRYYYYLTGDERTGEILDEVKDAELALYETDPLRYFYEKEKMTAPTHARSGPDWSALCSDWLTRWERTGEQSYLDKILRGIADLKKTPLGLVSGTDFEFDPATAQLVYIGEQTSASFHLQDCQGAPQIWLEMLDLIDDPSWADMLAFLGRFIYADAAEREVLGKGLTGTRYFHYPYFAASLGAFAAVHTGDDALAQKVIRTLFYALMDENNTDGFHAATLPDGKQEIPWISTNFASQWCLNAIMLQ